MKSTSFSGRLSSLVIAEEAVSDEAAEQWYGVLWGDGRQSVRQTLSIDQSSCQVVRGRRQGHHTQPFNAPQNGEEIASRDDVDGRQTQCTGLAVFGEHSLPDRLDGIGQMQQ